MHDGPIMEPHDALHSFRRSFYECLPRRADALFEIADALLAADGVPSPVHLLSLQAPHRRGWGSLYAALDQGSIEADAMRRLLARHPLAGGEDDPPVYAVDLSVWPRCDAEASPERGYYYHPSRHSAGKPIVAGWAYQFIAQLNYFVRESWTAPVDARRVHPDEDANAVAAGQIEALLVGRSAAECRAPLFVFDAGYDPVKVQQGLGCAHAQILVRLRAGRCFYADPSGPPAPTGRHRRHGDKFDCKDPSTWPEPSAEHACEDVGYGKVRVRAWSRLHPKVQNHAGLKAAGAPRRSWSVRWCWWRWKGCREVRGGASRESCGCGGTARANRIWIFCGGPTLGASTLSIPSASSSKHSDGRPPGCATPGRLTAGRGWFWPRSRNCAWRGRVWPTGGCRGRDAAIPVG